MFNTLQLISLKSYKVYLRQRGEDRRPPELYAGTLARQPGLRFVRLSDELKYINSYLFIIKCKFEEKIVSSVEVPNELMDCLIPSCTLQPLIENAIVHGLTPKFGQGRISLTAAREADHL